MRFSCLSLLLLLAVLSCSSTFAQQSVPRDPQALAMLQHSFTAMGGVVPADSVATGNITLVAGSKSETGTIRILTRGTDQSAEQLQMTAGNRAVIYSRGVANETQGTSVKSLQMELVVTSQSPDFPLPLLAAALADPGTAFQYLGPETLDGLQVHHIRFWNTFSSNLKGRHLVSFSIKDLWIDGPTGIPRKLSYIRRGASGSEAGILIEVFYSDYRNVGAILYPFHIEKSLNGTPWATITLQSVAFNTGLIDADFHVQ